MDNIDAARQMTEHLLTHGHTRIDFLDPWKSTTDDEHHSRRDRVDGYRSVMEKAGLTPRVWRKDNTLEDVQAVVYRLLDRPDRPTAVLCYWFDCVPTIFRVALDLGLSIPRDISVATFGPEEMDAFDLRVTAMLDQTYQLSRSCVEMLCQIVNGGEPEPASLKVPFVWQENGTTGRR
jgi:DNA-binding LacI/PurR family transcriptional regulator